jgi:hypothetical protein
MRAYLACLRQAGVQSDPFQYRSDLPPSGSVYHPGSGSASGSAIGREEYSNIYPVTVGAPWGHFGGISE